MIEQIDHTIGQWSLRISDDGAKNKKNPNKLDFNKESRECLFHGCTNTIMITRTSGLCDTHQIHQHDLLLTVFDTNNNPHSVPTHQDIIECIIEWAKSRNFLISQFFEKLSFSVLGNIPDVTSLASEVSYPSHIHVPNLKEVFDLAMSVAENYFPKNNNSSYQPLVTNVGEIPAIVLAHIFIGLVVCEEANRSDRWHCRIVRKDENKTSQLGGAMPIAYYAARSFNWGIEMGPATRRLLTR